MSESMAGSEPAFDQPDRKRLVLAAGIGLGVLILGGGGYLLLGGGGSGDDAAFTPPVHRTPASAAPSATASASPKSELAVFRGAVGRDPFELPAKVAGAQAPPAAVAAPVAAAPLAAPSASPTSVVIPGVGTVPLGTLPAGLGTVTISPSTGATSGTAPAPASSTAPSTLNAPVQFLQLLKVQNTAHGWNARVRTNNGVFTVHEGTKDVGGTRFFFVGEDEQAGKPTFVFTVGESEGGNLVPDATQTEKKVKADDSTLVLKHGQVDGGLYSE